MAKIFVLDTNIILHDHQAIKRFQENDLVIPIAVIEELDKFKKGNDALSFNARAFMRDINKLTDKREFGPEGISLGKRLGNIKIEPNHPFTPEFADLFKDDTQDHRILSTALWVRAQNPGRFVALVTKDINLRLKAKAVGMPAQDYQAGRVDDEHLYDLEREVMYVDADPQVIQQLAYGQDNSIDWKEVSQKEPKPNQLYKFDLGGTTVCARYDTDRDRIVLVRTKEAYGIRPRNDEQRFALDACLNPAIPLVSLTGGAGTGKTLIALAAALEQEKDFDQIILSRPTVVLGGQDIGFLPGDQRSKMSPYVQPLMDNLDVIKRCFKPGLQAGPQDRVDAQGRETPHLSPRLHPRPLPRQGVLHCGRGPEPHPARGQDHHHPRRRRHEDGLHGRHFPDRPALPGPVVQRPDAPRGEDERTAAVPAYLPSEGRTVGALRHRRQAFVRPAPQFF